LKEIITGTMKKMEEIGLGIVKEINNLQLISKRLKALVIIQ
jgi:hypothetical protein